MIPGEPRPRRKPFPSKKWKENTGQVGVEGVPGVCDSGLWWLHWWSRMNKDQNSNRRQANAWAAGNWRYSKAALQKHTCIIHARYCSLRSYYTCEDSYSNICNFWRWSVSSLGQWSHYFHFPKVHWWKSALALVTTYENLITALRVTLQLIAFYHRCRDNSTSDRSVIVVCSSKTIKTNQKFISFLNVGIPIKTDTLSGAAYSLRSIELTEKGEWAGMHGSQRRNLTMRISRLVTQSRCEWKIITLSRLNLKLATALTQPSRGILWAQAILT